MASSGGLSSRFRHGLVLLATVAGAAIGCNSPHRPDNEDLEASRSRLALKVAIPADNDVAAISYAIQKVDCASGAPLADPVVEVRPIEDQTVPGAAANLQNDPLAAGSAHAFADLFVVLDPGCYDIATTPLKMDGSKSERCAPAGKRQVMVGAGLTTEIVLINQCRGADRGAADVVSAINHEPVLNTARFTDSKFSCGSPAEFCATAHDIDGDPLELVLSAASAACTVQARGEGEGAPTTGLRQCWTVNCNEVGKVDLLVQAYDQLIRNGTPVRIEDWLTTEGYPNRSHAQLQLGIYFDGTKVYPDADGDGYGDASAPPTLVCTAPPPGFVANNGDCNDSNAAISPAATETCFDKVDNNCNGQIDEGCPLCQTAQVCDTYETGACACGPVGVCARTAEGDAQCIDGATGCAGLADCTTSADCAAGARCLVDSCCGRGVCVAPPQMCLMPRISSPPAPAVEGATIARRAAR